MAVAAVLVAGSAAGFANAQQYAADGGFSRPRQVAEPVVAGTVAVASDASGMQLLWASTDGIWRRPLYDIAAEPERLTPPGSIRGVYAATVGSDIAVAWLERDLRTGRTSHFLQWRSQTYLLFEANLEVPLLVGANDGVPWVLAAPRSEGEAHLTLYGLSRDGELQEPEVLYSTPLNVTGVRSTGTAPGSNGPAYVAWLEGRTDTGALGGESEWWSYVMSTEPGAVPVALGLADVSDRRYAVAVGQTADGVVRALWLTEAGALELTSVAGTPGAPVVVGRHDVAEAGRTVAFVGSDVYWLSDEFIRRGTVDSSGALSELTSVVWSPVPVEGAAIDGGYAVASPSDAATTLVWYGRSQGGAVSAYASDDLNGFTPGLKDRIAEVMGWSPWTPWQEAIGQALTALIAGLSVTLGLAPLLFVIGIVLARVRSFGSRPALLGAVVGIVTPLLLLVVIALRYPSPELSAVLSLGALLRALPWLVGGGVLGYLLASRRDGEAQMIAFMAACGAVLIATTTMAFVNYHVWASFIGII